MNIKRILGMLCAGIMCCTLMGVTVAAAGAEADPEPYTWVEKNGYTYARDNETGMFTVGVTWIDGDTYSFDSEGRMKTEKWDTDIEGLTYYFGEDGKAVCNGIYEIGKNRYCFNVNGEMQTGLTKFNDNYYYFNKDTGRMVKGLVKIKGNVYCFAAETGRMTSGWVTINGNKYYFGNDGKMLTGKKLINGVAYTFGADGILQD